MYYVHYYYTNINCQSTNIGKHMIRLLPFYCVEYDYLFNNKTIGFSTMKKINDKCNIYNKATEDTIEFNKTSTCAPPKR